uniref:Major facilitator superfamily domain-containing protein 12-like n=1 Tax=Saccoglossus kowalevskii TaxID=10224 RepID=A0ABM0M3K8_SACKO|nr:PREDICTED: major facilitator superfamily domain-containing protein 12-like [Saccoglossus kowalevskii]
MSFTDKLSNGVAIILIQDFHPCVTCCVECKWYYQYIMVFVPGGFAVFALIILAILAPQKIGKRRRDTHLNNVAGSESTNEDKNHSEHTSLLSDEIIETHGSINT